MERRKQVFTWSAYVCFPINFYCWECGILSRGFNVIWHVMELLRDLDRPTPVKMFSSELIKRKFRQVLIVCRSLIFSAFGNSRRLVDFLKTWLRFFFGNSGVLMNIKQNVSNFDKLKYRRTVLVLDSFCRLSSWSKNRAMAASYFHFHMSVWWS